MTICYLYKTMASQVQNFASRLTETERREVNEMLYRKVFPNETYADADFFENEFYAFRLLEHWTEMMYATEQKAGNLVTIRDSRPRKCGTRLTRWRVSVYYRPDSDYKPEWFTSKHMKLASAITNAVLNCYSENYEITELEKSL